MHRRVHALILAVVCAAAVPAFAQWPKHVQPGIPKTADGKFDTEAPAPRLADGKVDLSGVWEIAPARGRGRGAGPATPSSQAGALPPAPAPGTAAPPAPAGAPPAAGRGGRAGGAPGAPGTGNPLGGNVFGNIGGQTPGGAPYQPWAADLVKKRIADNSKDNPDAQCLPMGIMQMTSHPYPRKFIQTPTELIAIYEASGTTVREIFMDGRQLPAAKDLEPWWNGYSVGHWDGDTLVVETIGFMDDGWLDVQGSPLTNAGKITERYRRPNFGTMELEVTIDDPKAYTKPFSAKVNYRLSTDTQLIEFVCIDKDAKHYVGADHPSNQPAK
jgi:hypothetical protein